MTHVPILALDLATRLGWAHRNRLGQIRSGVLRLPSDAIKRVQSFEEWLRERFGLMDLWDGVVAYEEPILGVAPRKKGDKRPPARTAAAHRVVCHLEATVLRVCGSWHCLVGSLHPTRVKKHATGKGNAKKAEVVTAMQKRWRRPELEDDNEADALALLSWAIEGVARIEAEERAA